MTRTPAWKAARAERRRVERDALEERRRIQAEVAKANVENAKRGNSAALAMALAVAASSMHQTPHRGGHL